MAAEPTQGTLDPILRKPAVTLGILAVAAVAPVLTVAFVPPIRAFFQWLVSEQFWFSLALMVVVWQMILLGCAACILAERKISAYIQDRVGPNRVGWLGLLQPIADGVKFFLKEDIIPRNVDKPLFLLAPCISLVIALLGFIIIPWTGPIRWPWMADGSVVGQIVSIDIGFLYLVGVSSLGVYGVVLAGYASNNKYSFYGGMRATAQMLSYEIPLGLGLLVVLLVAGDLRLESIVAQQAHSGTWFVLLQPLAFLLVLVATFAETNRLPFDLAESEQELVGGFHTEYSAMKFAMFFLGEYAHMITGSAVMVALFWGGYAPLPFTNVLAGPEPVTWWAAAVQFGVYWGKVAAFILLFMVVRWTIPRFRYDQLMRLAWQGLIPLGIALVLGTGVLVVCELEKNIPASLAMNAIVLIGALLVASRSRRPVTGRQDYLPEVEVRPL
jgi:NADH-quinone oxidoreductase subunit H